MASTNQSPQYQKAEAKFLGAQTDEDRLSFLEEMIRECPKHKSAEKMLAQLKTRRKKLLKKIEKKKKLSRSKAGKPGIKKEDMQAVIVGFTNSGKSSLLKSLTNASPEIASYKFTTKKPIVGMMPYKGMQIQVIEIPSFESEYYDKGLVNTADIIIILINDIKQINQIEKELNSAKGKRLVVFNTKDLEKTDRRKISATLKTKKYNFVMVSTKTGNLENLKEKLFQSFGRIRVYTKEPGKEKSEKPLIFEPEATLKDVAEKIFKTSETERIVKEARVTGPSSKFPNQKVGLNHVLKDLDVVEFRTR